MYSICYVNYVSGIIILHDSCDTECILCMDEKEMVSLILLCADPKVIVIELITVFIRKWVSLTFCGSSQKGSLSSQF